MHKLSLLAGLLSLFVGGKVAAQCTIRLVQGSTSSTVVCVNSPVVTTRYVTTFATGATFSGLPAGVAGFWVGDTITIIGTPAVSGIYPYTIGLTGPCGNTSASGTITVNPSKTITLSSANSTISQTLCMNTAITPIVYNTTGATSATFSNLPPGVTGTFGNNRVTISGRPTFAQTFNYTVHLVGGCGNATASGTIAVNPLPGASLTPVTQTICSGALILPLVPGSNTQGTLYTWTRDNAQTTGINNSGTGTISGRLTNTTAAPQTVTFTIVPGNNSTGCAGAAVQATVVVNPSPVATVDPLSQAVCSGGAINEIQPTSTLAGTVFNWTRDNQVITGIGGNGVGSISGSLTNATRNTVMVNFAITPEFTNEGVTCSGPVITSTVVVNPVPVITAQPSTQSICSGAAFKTIVVSSNVGGPMRWTRDNLNLPGTPDNGTGDIEGRLFNNTEQPITVNISILPVYSNAGATCPGQRSTVSVIVNPTPTINSIPNFTYCNREVAPQINFSSNSPDSAFTWRSNPDIGFGTSGSSFISRFTATNIGEQPITATVTASVVSSNDRCAGPDRSFTITVRPSPPRPNFTGLLNTRNTDTLIVCQGSNNINFNITQPTAGVTYLWTANSPLVTVRDRNDANTVVSFAGPGLVALKATATNAAYICTDTTVQVVRITPMAGFVERRIILKQPGNLLVYPDNSLDTLNGYQWGYDSLVRSTPDTAYGTPHAIPGQVYQTLITSNRFVRNNQLDTTKYAFWVMLKNGDCYSRVYYNGPYARLRPQAQPNNVVTIAVNVYPNPNTGTFMATLQGNLYGAITATVLNSLGQVIHVSKFFKSQPTITQSLHINTAAPPGVYYLMINSSDLKKAIARFVIQH